MKKYVFLVIIIVISFVVISSVVFTDAEEVSHQQIENISFAKIFNPNGIKNGDIDNPKDVKKKLMKIGYSDELEKQGNNLVFTIDDMLKVITINLNKTFFDDENEYSISIQKNDNKLSYKYYINKNEVNEQDFQVLEQFKELLTYSQVNGSILLYTEIYLEFIEEVDFENVYLIDDSHNRIAYSILTPKELKASQTYQKATEEQFNRFKDLTAVLPAKDEGMTYGNFDEYFVLNQQCEKYGAGGYADYMLTGKSSACYK